MRRIVKILGCCALAFGLCVTGVSADALTIVQAQQKLEIITITRTYDECVADYSGFAGGRNSFAMSQAGALSSQDAQAYFGGQLDANEKEFYDQLEENIEKTYDGKSEIEIDCGKLKVDQNNFERVFVRATEAFFADHPEVFWIYQGSLSISAKGTTASPYFTSMILKAQDGKENYYIPANMTGNKQQFNGAASVVAAKQQLETVANECLSQIPAGASDYDKLKVIHDWLAERIDYDLAYSDQGVYSSMILKRGVCAGYTESFNYLARKAGIDSVKATGVGYTSPSQYENHAWNLVHLNNAWYGVDVTWDDQTEKSMQKIYDDYFLVGSDTVAVSFDYQAAFSASHRMTNYFSNPAYVYQFPTMSKTAFDKNTGVTPPEETNRPTPTDNPVPTDNPNPPQIKMGDVNGDGKVNLEDAKLTLNIALGIAVEDTTIKEAADMDGQDGVTLEDARIILQIALGIIEG